MAYVTIAEADTFLSSSEWTSLTTTEKQYAIDLGEMWIDKNFTCTVEDPVQEVLQRANSYLAELQAKGTLFTPKGGDVESVSVKAGPVTVSEKYENSEQAVDQFDEIKLLINSTTCSTISTFQVLRV